jgi:hypothetical protein
MCPFPLESNIILISSEILDAVGQLHHLHYSPVCPKSELVLQGLGYASFKCCDIPMSEVTRAERPVPVRVRDGLYTTTIEGRQSSGLPVIRPESPASIHGMPVCTNHR